MHFQNFSQKTSVFDEFDLGINSVLRFNFSSVDSGFIVVMEASNIAEWLQIS
jgi:hypothetical protein